MSKNCHSILGLNLACRKSYEKSQQLRVPGKSHQIQFVIQDLKTIPNNVVLDFLFFIPNRNKDESKRGR